MTRTELRRFAVRAASAGCGVAVVQAVLWGEDYLTAREAVVDGTASFVIIVMILLSLGFERSG